jgi:phosphatidylglycerophosphate synthase
MSQLNLENRRPLKSRSTGWARTLATFMARLRVTPDAISAMSMIFAGLGGWLLVWAGHLDGALRAAYLIGAGACVQLRLLCNLLDGMVAVEHGKGSPSGPIWNELPDRIADAFFLMGAGYCAESATFGLGSMLGWIAALLAVLTAYVRELGRGLDFPADFSGPMAKPHRMAALTAACVVSAAEPLWGWAGQSMAIGLVVIILGSAFTVGRRTRTLALRLAARA